MGLDHEWITIDEVVKTEHLSKVYNLRVEQDHTYFVGALDWNFAVWVHNDYKYRQISDELIEVYDDARDAGDQVVGTITKRPKPGASGQHEYHYKSNHNKDANGNFYEETFISPDDAVKKFNEQKNAGEKAATAGLGETPKVDGDVPKTSAIKSQADNIAEHAKKHWSSKTVDQIKGIINDVLTGWKKKFTTPDGKQTFYIKDDIVLVIDNNFSPPTGGGTIFKPDNSANAWFMNKNLELGGTIETR